MQSWFARKIALPCSSTCTIGGGGVPYYLWKFPKSKQEISRSPITISQNEDRVKHGREGGCYAVC